jgi:ABC-2 type transport system permease protein
MRLYRELARRAFQQQLTYRAAALAGIFTNGIFGVMIAAVYLALYRSTGSGNDSVGGLDSSQTMTWVWLNQSLLMTVYMWGWWEVVRAIQSGAIAMELLKPYDYFSFWLSRDLGRALAHMGMRGLPTFAIGLTLFDVQMPETVPRFLAFVLSVVLAVTASFCLRFISNLFGFWVLDFRGIAMMYAAIVNLFSGMLIPLTFFPGPIESVANLLPFRAIMMIPSEIYLGERVAWNGLLIQAFWIVVLVFASQRLMRLGERHLVVQGG